MRMIHVIAPVLVLASVAAMPPARAADLPSVDTILAKHIEAMGGKEAMEKIHSRVIQFKLESDTLGNSEGELSAMAPNKQRLHVDLAAGAGAMDEGFDGTAAWAKNPWQGLRTKDGEELAKVKRDAEFHNELKLKTLYPGLACTGTEKIGEEEAYVLEAKPTSASKEKFWISTKTGLALRQDSEYEGPQGPVIAEALPRDYQAFDGVKYPTSMKMKISAGGQVFEFTMKFTNVKHNVDLAAAKFAKPAE